jgi:hypothetical protein
MMNIGAFTEPGIAPAFISINDLGSMIEITVRSKGAEGGVTGDCASIKMSREHFADLLSSCARYRVDQFELGAGI